MRFLLLAFLSAAAFGQNKMWLRDLSYGVCSVTGATNATPIRVTVDNAAACQLANGVEISVQEVHGNVSANSRVSTLAEGQKHACRKVANLSGNSFDLMDCSGAAVAGNGTFTTYPGVRPGRVGRVNARTPHDTMGGYLGGAGSALVASLTDTGGRKNASNPAYVALQVRSGLALDATWGKSQHAEISGQLTPAATALRCLVDSHAPSCASADFHLSNPDQLTGTNACNEAWQKCGGPNSWRHDYPTQSAAWWVMAYQIRKASLSPGARANILAYFFNHLPWSQGGFDYTGAAWVKPAWKVAGSAVNTDDLTRGLVAIAQGSTSMTCAGGTCFAGVVVGDVVIAPGVSQTEYGQYYRVAAVNSSTSITVETPAQFAVSGATFLVGPGWAADQEGLLWVAEHYDYDPAGPDARVRYPNSSFSYDQTDLLGSTPNLVIARLLGRFALGVGFCSEDYRACIVGQRAWDQFADVVLRHYLTFQVSGGWNPANLRYNDWRVLSAFGEIAVLARNGFVSGGPDLCGGVLGSWCEDGAKLSVNQLLPYAPDVAKLIPWAEPANFGFNFSQSEFMRAGVWSAILNPSATSTRNWLDVIRNRAGTFDAGWIRNNAWMYYLAHDPAQSSATPPLSQVGQNTYRSFCAAIWGDALCPAGHGRHAGITRSAWGNNYVLVFNDAASGEALDHGYHGKGGSTYIYGNGMQLLGKDGSTEYGNASSPQFDDGVVLNSYATVPEFPTTPGNFPSAVPQASADDTHYHFLADLTGTVKAGANATGLYRRTIRLGEYVIDAFDVAQSVAGQQWSQYFLRLNGCGTPASSSCASVDRAAKTFRNEQAAAGGLVGKFFGAGSTNIALTTAANSNTDLSYAGGGGTAGRFFVCPSSDGSTCAASTAAASWYGVFRRAASVPASLPVIQTSAAAGSWRVVEIRDASAPAVVAFTPGAAPASSLAFTSGTTGTTEYLVAGLAAGSYEVTIGGAPVGSFTVAAGNNTVKFSGPPGAVSVASGAVGPGAAGVGQKFGGILRGGKLRGQ